MPLSLLFVLAAAVESDCASVAACNAAGSAAYQARDYAQALAHFERQIDLADTAAGDETDAKAENARQLALNNAALALLRAGRCLRAAAYLDAADPAHAATAANRGQWQKRCAAQPALTGAAGEYWQYAGHGSWNSLQLVEREGGLRVDAFWMRVGRGPLSENGPAAFGSLEDVALELDGSRAQARFEGNDGEVGCLLRMRFDDAGVELDIEDEDNCQVGGAGAWLGGRYRRVEADPPAAAD